MRKIVDLTLTYTADFQGFSKAPAKTIEKDGWNASTLVFYSHCGTHMDAPVHFNAGPKTIDQMPVSDFFGNAWIIDLRSIGAKGLIKLKDIQEHTKHFQKGDSLILWTGWSKYVNEPTYRDDLPRVSDELAHWCVENEVKMLGVEPPSVADVNNLEEVTRIHQILLGSVIIIEGLTNLDQLSSDNVELVALPLKIESGDGSPARVVAIENVP